MRNLLEIHFEHWYIQLAHFYDDSDLLPDESVKPGGGALVYIAARDVVESLCRDLEFYAFKSGDVIVRQGEEGDHLFIVEA